MRSKVSRSGPLRWLFAFVLIALVAAACGDDGGGGNTADPSDGPDTAEPEDNTPVSGGSGTFLLYSEIDSLDPRTMAGSSAGASGIRAFALYGGLVLFDGETNKAEPVQAESLTSSADFVTWTLKLKPGMTFTDGTPFDAEAVKTTWESMKEITRRSPSLTLMLTTESFTVVDPTTLTIQLHAPNAHFDKALAQSGATFIASADAITNEKDMTSEAFGAGPFTLTSWTRDDRMVMKKNPDWKGSEGPYLDELIFRVVGDEQQRVDSFNTGQVDGFYTATPKSANDALKATKGSVYVATEQNAGQTYVFNTSKPPFDDLRARMAFAQGVDWQGMADTVFGEGAEATTNYTIEGSPWYTPAADLPTYDKEAAQKHVDEYLAATGQQKLVIDMLAFQQSLDQARGKFIQTSLSQLKNVEVNVEVNDSPTNIGKVLAAEYMVSSWGIPHIDPEPRVHNSVHSTSFTNFPKYNNPEVDAALDAGRVTDDQAARKAAYDKVYEILAKEIPYLPYVKTINGFVLSPEIKGGHVQEDGILRFDLLWKSN